MMEAFVLVAFMVIAFVFMAILGLAFAYGLIKESHVFSPPTTPRAPK